MLRLHPAHLYRLCANREIPFIKRAGLGIRFDEGEIEEWLKQGEVKPDALFSAEKKQKKRVELSELIRKKK